MRSRPPCATAFPSARWRRRDDEGRAARHGSRGPASQRGRARSSVVLVNGGSARSVPGTWSATSELLADELAPRFPGVSFVEVRYRVKTWNELSSCMADAEAALDLVHARQPARRLLHGRGGLDRGRRARCRQGRRRARSLDSRPAPARRIARQATRRDPRLLGPLSARRARCQRCELTPRVRAGPGARRRGLLHADRARPPRCRAPLADRWAPAAATLACVGRPRRRDGHAVRGRGRIGAGRARPGRRAGPTARRRRRPAVVASAGSRSAGARPRRGPAARAP